MQIVIPGNPIAKARPKFFRRGKHVGTYNPQETEEGKFLLLAMQQLYSECPLSVPLSIDCLFVMPRPKGHFGTGRNEGTLKQSAPLHHIKTPDLDNLIKFALDCLNKHAWNDDAQVVSVTALKRYGSNPRTILNIRKFE